MNLNPGGLIGALVGGGLVGFLMFSSFDPEQGGRAMYRLPILGLVAGAFAGNYLWAAVLGGEGDA